LFVAAEWDVAYTCGVDCRDVGFTLA